MLGTTQTLLVLCPLIFFAGFVDSVAGGGGLISLPAYLICGFPAHVALGSNKFSASIGTLTATYRYWKSGVVNVRVALVSAGMALIGSFAGSQLALLASDRFLRLMLLFLLPVTTVLVLFRRTKNNNPSVVLPSLRATLLLSAAAGLLIGAYDGFFGPGTGTFLIIIFTVFLKFDYRSASGTAKVVNLASNLAALASFAFSFKVAYWAAIPAALCSIAGNWIGSGLAIKKGSGFIRIVLVGVLCLLFARILYDYLT